MGKSRATVVYNPLARKVPTLERLRRACATCAGWEIDIRPTEGAGQATELARQAVARGSEVVFACGGDGTVNEVANGLAGTGRALAVIRGGTSNVFAAETRVPRAPERALRVLNRGRVRQFDLGVAGERRFLMMAGLGFDAHSIRGVSEALKRWLGVGAYYGSSAVELVRHRSVKTRVSIDGVEREIDLYWLVLGNTPSYAGLFDVTPGAMADDGLLDLCMLGGRNRVWTMLTLAAFTVRRHSWGRSASFGQAREVVVSTPGIPVHVDGEYVAETPMRFTVEPKALLVLTPSSRRLSMLSERPK